MDSFFWFIIGLTTGGIVGIVWMFFLMSSIDFNDVQEDQDEEKDYDW